MRRAIPALAAAVVIGMPIAQAAAAAKPRKVVTTTTKTYQGPTYDANQWGPLYVDLTIKTTTTKIGTKKTVKKAISNIVVPLYPNHTGRSIYINQTALPWLIQEVMKAQSANVNMISGATFSSQAFLGSVQGALTAAAYKA